MVHENNKLHERITREIMQTKELASNDLKWVEKEIKDMINDNRRQRIRDKADNDIRHGKNEDRIHNLDQKLSETQESSSALAVVTSMLIENVNMQMEAEMADLLDRRMMSLFGVSPTKADKIAVQNTSTKLKTTLKHHTSSRSPEPRFEEVEATLPSIEPKRNSGADFFGTSADEQLKKTISAQLN
jgi:hypothetical protein